MYRRNNASSLLQKASSQLSGQKPTSRSFVAKTNDVDSEEEIDKYLSSLGKKTNVSKKFSSVDDLSISSSDGSFKQSNFSKNTGEDGDRSKFLKKPAKTGGTTKVLDESNSKPLTTSSTFNQTGTMSQKNMSPALNKVANLTSKYLKKDVSMKPKASALASDSDMDMDMSQDSDVLADMKQLKTRTESHAGKKADPVNRFLKGSSVRGESHDRTSGIMSDSKFVKKSTRSSAVTGVQQSLASSEESESDSSFAKPKSFLKKGSQLKNVQGARKESGPMTSTPKKTSVKPAQSLTVDTDEEDLAQFMRGLSSPPGGGAGADLREGSSVSVISNSEPVSVNLGKDVGSKYNVQFSEEDQESEDGPSQSLSSVESYKGDQLLSLTSLKSPVSEERPLPADVHSASEVPSVVESDDETTKGNILGQFGLSTLDDLDEPIQPAPRQKPSPTRLFNKVGLFTLDDLEAVSEVGQSPDIKEGTPTPGRDKYASDFESGPSNSSRPESVNTISSVSEVKTASPVKSHYSDNFDTDLSGKDSVRSSSSSSTVDSRTLSKTRTASDKTVNTVEDSVSLLSQSYSRDSSTVTKSSAPSKSSVKSKSTVGSSRSSRTSASSHVKSIKHDPDKKRRVPSKSVEVQTVDPAGLAYTWNSAFSGQAVAGGQVGGAYVDPSPIASHVVSPDALEAMTAYSPAVLALNDMLRQQLNLTRNFMEIQQRSYQSAMESIQPSYVYTTLEDTKRYIKRKQKPRLTFKQALKQVQEEMGL